MSDALSREEHIANYVRNLAAIEEAIAPFKEQMKDLRKEYVENTWLTKEDIKMAVKAYRLSKAKINIDELVESHNTLVNKFVISEE
jgi:NH3-dependent NAD+ synthetase